MSRLVRVGDIMVPQHLEHERRAYRVRQGFAVLFALTLVAALLGLLGRGGPLSDTTRSDGSRLSVQYQRFVRLQSTTQLQVQLGAGSGQTNVAISKSLLDAYAIQDYSAQPQDTTVLPDRVVYTFDQKPPADVSFDLVPQRIGRLRGTVYGPGGSRVHLTQWVWP